MLPKLHDEAFKRSIFSRSMLLIGAINVVHSTLELFLHNYSPWTSWMGISAGCLYIAISIFLNYGLHKYQNINVAQISIICIATGVPYLGFRIWSLNGIDGASAGWFTIFAIYAALFNSKKALGWSVAGSIIGFLVTSYFCKVYPQYDYSLYPQSLSWLLSSYLIFTTFYHMHLLQEFIQHSEEKIQKQRVLAFHNTKMADIGRLSGHIAHEVNTPLNTLMLLSNEILNNLPQTQANAARDLIDKQKTVIERISTTLNTLLRSAKEVAPEQNETIQPEIIIDDIRVLLDYRLKESDVTLKWSSDFSADKNILQSSRAIISQVLVILLNNSIDAVVTKNKTKWVDLHFTHDDKFVYIDVFDSGPGVPAEILPKLFSEGLTSKKSGSGIGLNLARGLIEDIKGTLVYMPKILYTQFRISLPRFADIAKDTSERKSHGNAA